ncbi:MAG: type III pantothenate kinase [Candidatus Binatia bacterium]|nr:MAG: type III pantothenate kinase [Candidatus Binatia bacterium]
MTTVLTVDVGNSRVKLRLWGARAAADLPVRGVERRLGKLLDGWREEGLSPDAALLTSVATPERTRAIVRVLGDFCRSVVLDPEPPLENRYERPEEVGRDRLYAASGAYVLLGRSAVVVDAGTALTVDALRVEGSKGVFCGGSIFPGPELLAQALARRTAKLPRFVPEPWGRACGRSTLDALRGGVALGFRGAASWLVESLAREAEIEQAPVVLTGGARRFLLEPFPFTERELRVEPDLVAVGLLVSGGFGELLDSREERG